MTLLTYWILLQSVLTLLTLTIPRKEGYAAVAELTSSRMQDSPGGDAECSEDYKKDPTVMEKAIAVGACWERGETLFYHNAPLRLFRDEMPGRRTVGLASAFWPHGDCLWDSCDDAVGVVRPLLVKNA